MPHRHCESVEALGHVLERARRERYHGFALRTAQQPLRRLLGESRSRGLSLTNLSHTLRGQRKYLTQHERDRFLKAARSAPTPVRAVCEILSYTGCRLSEALALTPERVDPAAGVVIFESLKKRRRGVFRAVPVPTGLLETLARLRLRNARFGLDSTLWSWSRTTAWRRLRAVMTAAEVEGSAATPKGLRHCFGIVAVAAAVPLTIIQKWMGHSDVATTAIYLACISHHLRAKHAIRPPGLRCACLPCSLYRQVHLRAPSGSRLVLAAFSCTSPRHVVRNAGSLLQCQVIVSPHPPMVPMDAQRAGFGQLI